MPSDKGTTIAKAYVQIMPSSEGIKSKLEEILGKEIPDGAPAGKKWGESIGKGLAAAGTAAIAGLAAGTTAAVNLGKNALESYADYEQLVGGVETLFKSSADTIMAYADNAYQTAGLSANEYMETVTGFSAALIQSTGRGAQQDVEALAEALDEELELTKRGLEDQYNATKQGFDDQYTATKNALQDQYDALKSSWDERIRLTKDQDAKAILRAQRDEALKDLKRANEEELTELKRANAEQLTTLKRSQADELEAIKSHNKDLIAEAEAANNASVTTEESLARAAELADLAITDMADNANKMGSSMESIQNAYAGFSKQNYTMLDNLKLGYGGTKDEMERLLADAEAISGIHYDISSYADVVEAIHVIQTEMGITGTTAEEASQTISGSVSAMKASWANLVAGIADENANMDELVGNFVDSVLTVGDNLLPRVEQIVDGIAVFVEKASETLIPVVVNALVQHAPDLLQSGLMIIETLGQAIVSNAPALVSAASSILLTLVTDLVQALPQLIDVGFSIIFTLADALIEALPELIPAIVEVVLKIVEKLTDPDTLMQLIDVAFQLIGAIAVGLIQAIPKLIESAPVLISNLVESLLKLGPQLLASGNQLVTQLALGIVQAISKVMEAAGRLWTSLKDTIRQKIQEAVQWGRDLIQNFIDGLLGQWEAAKGAVKVVTDKIGGWFGGTTSNANESPASNAYASNAIGAISNGLRDSEDSMRRQMRSSFSLRGSITADNVLPSREMFPTRSATGAGSVAGQQVTVILTLDRMQCGKAIFTLNGEEAQRVGLQLAGIGGVA